MIATDGVVKVELVEVTSLEVDDRSGATTTRRDRVVFPSLGIPHGPTSAAHIQVLHTVDDFTQHVAQVARAPDALLDLDEFVTRQIDGHDVVTLTEGREGIEASGIQGD